MILQLSVQQSSILFHFHIFHVFFEYTPKTNIKPENTLEKEKHLHKPPMFGVSMFVFSGCNLQFHVWSYFSHRGVFEKRL